MLWDVKIFVLSKIRIKKYFLSNVFDISEQLSLKIENYKRKKYHRGGGQKSVTYYLNGP
jgi:hypothetical protein